ncbi:hypothetical protein RJ639_015243 [Escallonia herrerae]|uniref:Pentatricopeptide repeat-containing protein n=1 Tax=Escallonia herrerae TaxID=1293975 RepID=A0AA88VJV4_9ASTE|nr:hypothetical protein RJ639_015243 [Escallonia herrerae]
MIVLIRSTKFNQLVQIPQKLAVRLIEFKSTCRSLSTSETEAEIERITRIINDHPFPDHPLHPTLSNQISAAVLSTSFVENVLGRLFATHSNGLKAFEFFIFSLNHAEFCPSSDAFEKTLHILTRMRYFGKAWELMEEIQRTHPSLLTLKSMSIMLSKIAKFQSFEDTVEAFERMENSIFVGKKFGTDEFNVLLRAFCTQRQMKEARSILNKLHSRFLPNTKTMNILLLGFKESGDITAVELFYHETVKRGFKPNNVTYNIRIDAYCKKGCLRDGLRLFEEMERVDCLPSLETITTLIHGAGIARNAIKAKQLFDEISLRNLQPDTEAYNAYMSALIRSRDIKSAAGLMGVMEEKGTSHNNVTYHTLFTGLMRSQGMDGVCELYHEMIKRGFVPMTRTVAMLMKFFCINCRLDLALDFWEYLIKRGCCPHSHTLDLLVTGLCSRGRVQEAFECSKQMLERGRHVSEAVFRMLERYLLQVGEVDKLKELDQMTKRLQTVLPPSRGHAVGIPALPVVR